MKGLKMSSSNELQLQNMEHRQESGSKQDIKYQTKKKNPAEDLTRLSWRRDATGAPG